MNRLLLCLTMAVVALPSSTWAQDVPPDTPDFLAKKHSNAASGLDARVASFRERLDDGKTRLYYNVCNHAKEPLLFRWPKPGFESGIASPLHTQKCAVYSRDVLESIPDDDAKLMYWQNGEPHGAHAFTAKQSGWGKAKRTATTWLYSRGLGLGPDKPDQVKDVEIVVAETKGYLEKQVRWTGEGVSVALRLAEAIEKVLSQVRAQLGGQGRVVDAKTFIAELHPEDRARLPGSAMEGYILVLTMKGKGPSAAKFGYEVGDTSPATLPVVVLDSANRVVWVAQYSTVRKN